MAKMFYNAEEAAKKLGRTDEELKELVRSGDLREFRDAGKVNYKIEEIDALAAASPPASPQDSASDSAASASASGEIVLEPAEDSDAGLSAFGTDVLSIDEADGTKTPETSAGSTATKRKEGTAVPSVGVNVFDDDELDEQVDPLAQTAVTDVGGLAMDSSGSGSGILDLSRESDDTSLGAELLEEIYSTDGEAEGEMGEDTRAGLEEAIPEEPAGEAGETFEPDVELQPGQQRTVVTQTVEFAPDAVSASLTALVVVAVVVMWFAGLAAAALARGFSPAVLESVYTNLVIYAGGAAAVAAIAGAVTYFIVKRSG